MKRFFTGILLVAISLSAAAQKKEVTKTGINFGPLPAIGYSSDLGWHYGALTDIYWYGDGSKYPEYIWKANVEASWYSKGNSVYHAFFDSKYLIPGVRMSFDLSYFGNKTDNFYGFNGGSSLYVPALDQITNEKNKKYSFSEQGQGFYLMKRNILRGIAMFQGRFGQSHWGWAAGLTYYGVKTGHAENKGLAGYDKKAGHAATDLSLYDLYVKHGLIPKAEEFGGRHLEAKVGVVFDTRNHENNPSKGTNLEVYLYGSPDILNSRTSGERANYLKLAVHFKQFFTLVPDKLVFGGHLAFQGLLAGRTPSYMLQTIQTINLKQIRPEGLGSTCTVRGTLYNRLQGESYAWANLELRWNFARFLLFNQNFILATNPFFDMGMIVQPYKPAGADYSGFAADKTLVNKVTGKTDNSVAEYVASDFYKEQSQKLHMSAGIGLHIIMNQNFNINFEFGKCLDKNDGTGLGINVGLNYIF
jgi:outer membrane protein assembly factor BamA